MRTAVCCCCVLDHHLLLQLLSQLCLALVDRGADLREQGLDVAFAALERRRQSWTPARVT